MTPALLRASRYISWALRHAPDEAYLTLDHHGWASVRDLLHSMALHGHTISQADLAEIVVSDAKGRYSFSDNGKLVRANYGHSVDVVPDVAATVPPAVLFHGTARRSLPVIKQAGLLPQRRRFVHLTNDLASAFAIGGRHGASVVIVIDTAAMHADGLQFYPMTRMIWLTETVPPQYLNFGALIFDAVEPPLAASDVANTAPDPRPIP
jgi:putative RNA 2'-phosphotransferase